ncbi:MAG: aminomethyl-transferring glycine dehydrogenase subunit GcvPA [Clostridia bacterium]|nr:aminomethyl-transferring glycine dehydrogenase subunit GcvPA [Clostridia bacterium]
MGGYLPATDADRAAMLQALGLTDMEDLFACVPQAVRQRAPLNLPAGASELEVLERMRGLAGRNTVFPTVFRGAGAYRHFIPAIAKNVPAKETFLTAYTPYQAEMSQGLLQAIFEFQTMICALTGMDAANASVYDGATAAAEAAAMCRERARTRTVISATAHPQVIEVVRTYCEAAGTELAIIPAKDGITDCAALAATLSGSDACVIVQQPNYYGLLEDCAVLGEAAHATGAKFIMSVNPLAAALLRTPADCGADIAVGDGQSLGLPLAFGGPSLGFMAAKQSLARKLPGRIVGQTADANGNRAFVLTLQAREQHIRREKAGSSICSNQALCALQASVYMASMGPGGISAAAQQSMDNAHALAEGICSLPGYAMRFAGPYFHEFVTTCPDAHKALAALEQNGILGGLPIDEGILWCATELNTQQEIDRVVGVLQEVGT